MVVSRIRLDALYDARDLRDEEEALGLAILDAGLEILDEDFEVGMIEAGDLARLVTPVGGAPVLQAFEDHARPTQRRIVARKMKAFDEERIIVLSGTAVLDGQHHVVAAHQLGKPVRFIDLDAPAPEPPSIGGP